MSEILAHGLLENELLIPPPNSIAQTVWHLAMSDDFNKHFAATATEFIYGFCAACAMAVVLGYLMGMYRWFELKERHYKGKKIPPGATSSNPR